MEWIVMISLSISAIVGLVSYTVGYQKAIEDIKLKLNERMDYDRNS